MPTYSNHLTCTISSEVTALQGKCSRFTDEEIESPEPAEFSRVADKAKRFKPDHSHTQGCPGRPLCSASCIPVSILTHLFFHRQIFLQPPGCKLPEERVRTWTTPDTLHGRCPTAVCPQAGIQKEEEGVSSSKEELILHPEHIPAPGYCPKPGRHLLWVISICIVIITAFGKKIPLARALPSC